MINVSQLRHEIIRPTLTRCLLWSQKAENLIVGTGLVESEFSYLRQIEGPAISFWQLEPPTITWLLARLSNDRELFLRVKNTLHYADLPTDPINIIGNIPYACILARLKYWFDPTPLPDEDNILQQAKYWAKIYNTLNKKEDIERYVRLYDRYGEHLNH